MNGRANKQAERCRNTKLQNTGSENKIGKMNEKDRERTIMRSGKELGALNRVPTKLRRF
jgi:hypothetical protein